MKETSEKVTNREKHKPRAWKKKNRLSEEITVFFERQTSKAIILNWMRQAGVLPDTL